MRRALILGLIPAAALLIAIGTANSGTDGEVAAAVQTARHAGTIGDVLPGTDLTAFQAASDNFAQVEDINDGLGPVFNEKACGNCHNLPVLGGSGANIERRYGSFDNGVFFGYDRAPDDEGGTLRQLFANDPYTFSGQTCTVAVETDPADSTEHVGRRATPLFGLGLVDALPDSAFDNVARNQPREIRGTVNRVAVVFPDERDPRQFVGSIRVARFGLKAGVPGLMQFSADAYKNEMGITTQSCVKGTSIVGFAMENLPNGHALPAGCNGGDLAPANPPGDPQVPEFTDDVVGDCDGGRTEIQDDIANFRFFMERLAPPPVSISDPRAFLRGAQVFAQDGCAGCHNPIFTTPAHPFNGVPGNLTFAPFSDFLAHDMGALGDRIGNTGDSVATTRKMRTAPLWGARFNTQFLHDGRAKTVRDAILAHDGQGRAARNAFARESQGDQNALITFVNSI